MGRRTKIAVIVGSRGRGSNMVALVAATRSGQVEADVAVVIAPREDAPAVQTAFEMSVPVCVLDAGAESFGDDLLAELAGRSVAIVCLAGFMRLLPAKVIEAFPGRVLNIHPALLPKFGGKGMYGMHVHEAVIAAKEQESGCSVHFVTERYDEGSVLLQLRCEVEPADTPQSLAAKVLELEHRAYPLAVQKLVSML